MRRALVGAALMVGGVAGLVEASSHKLHIAHDHGPFGAYDARSGDLSQSAHDFLLIGASALLIFGAVLVLFGLLSQGADDE